MSLFPRWALVAALLMLVTAPPAEGQQLFATSFFSPADGDPNPGLSGVLRIDLATGSAEAFIPETAGGLVQATDVLLSADSQTLFVSSLDGRLWWYNAQTGAPLPSPIDGGVEGLFAQLPTSSFGDGYTTLHQRSATQIVAGTSFGSLTPYDIDTGAQGADLAAGLTFPSGISETPGRQLVVTVGFPFPNSVGDPPPGQVLLIDNGTTTTLVDFTDTPGVSGGSNPTVVQPRGDFDLGGEVDAIDYQIWQTDYRFDSGLGDANGDGRTDAADYTIWRDNLGAQSRLIVSDFYGNRLVAYDLDGANGEVLATIPPVIPDDLPPGTPQSNFPSEVLRTPSGTLLVSAQGVTQRPDNRGALLEFDLEGNLLRTVADDLPPLSGIAFAPAPARRAVPEPSTAVLLLVAVGIFAHRRS